MWPVDGVQDPHLEVTQAPSGRMLARRLLVGLDEGGEGLRDLPVIQLVDCKVAGKLDEPSPEGNEPVVGSLGLLLERLGNAPLQPVAVLVEECLRLLPVGLPGDAHDGGSV